MRVGILTYGLDRQLGGIGRYTKELIGAFTSLQAPDVEFVLLASGGLDALDEIPFDVYPLEGSRLLPVLMTRGQWQLRQLANKLKLDIIHDPTGITPLQLLPGKVRKVVTIHDVFPLSIPGNSTTLDTWIYRYWLPFATGRVDRVITVSEASKQDIQQYLRIPESKIDVIFNGRSERFKPATEEQVADVKAKYGLPDAPYILFLGSVEKRKNLKRVIEAYLQIADRVGHQLVIAGPKLRLFDEIVAISETNPEKITLTGYIDEEDLPTLYTGADLFLFPSIYEGFGLPVLEAMACRTAAITSTTSSLPEVAGEAAALVDPHNTDAIAATLLDILNDDNKRESMAAASIEQSKKFTWVDNANKTLAIYRELMA